MYYYGTWQPLYDVMERNLSNFTLHQGIPREELHNQFTEGEQHNMIILDDSMQEVVEKADITLLFTQGCHHRQLIVIFITQKHGRYSLTIALNTWY